PPEVLCVTFTNLAAREMRERVVQRCGREAGAVVVRTFHALAAWILRLEAKALGLPADFADLITWCVAALTTDGPVRDRWQRRFAMVQVDEMQDTHMAEYLIVRELARNAASVVLAG